jgi:ribulose kinase
MEVPKVLWLKNHMDPSKFYKSQFFDLPDFLTHRASLKSTRSSCSLTAKFLPDLSKPDGFFKQIGLDELISKAYVQVGFPTAKTNVLYAGLPVGAMDQKAAKELGLEQSTIVASSLIDAYVSAFAICSLSLI